MKHVKNTFQQIICIHFDSRSSKKSLQFIQLLENGWFRRWLCAFDWWSIRIFRYDFMLGCGSTTDVFFLFVCHNFLCKLIISNTNVLTFRAMKFVEWFCEPAAFCSAYDWSVEKMQIFGKLYVMLRGFFSHHQMMKHHKNIKYAKELQWYSIIWNII